MVESNEQSPPKWADRLLSWFCRDELHEEILGDLHEFFEAEYQRTGRHMPWWQYWYHAFHFMRPFALRRTQPYPNAFIMSFSHFKIAFRRLTRQKVLSSINILGLSLGMAAFIMILLFVKDELDYDQFHENPEQLYRLGVSLEIAGQIYDEASIQFPAAAFLKQDFPEIKEVVRVYKNGFDPFLQVGDEKYIEDELFFVDHNFFEVFGYDLVEGNKATALKAPNSILLTQTMATKYFGDKNALGKRIKYQGRAELEVTGVIREPRSNTHFPFEFLVPMDFQLQQWERVSGLEGREKKWFWTGAWTYVRLQDEQSHKALAEKLPGFIDSYFPDRYKQGSEFLIQPIRSIHLDSHLDNEISANAHRTYVFIFGAVALIVLFIACINFINLNTIQALNRAREIGTRRVIGAGRLHMTGLVISESFLITLFSALVAILLIAWLLPLFNSLTDKTLDLVLLLHPANLLVLLAIIIGVSSLSGLYPAILVSKFQTVRILKGTIGVAGNSSMIRKALITVQFVASIALIISILMVDRQLSYLNNKDKGYDSENLLVLSARSGVNRQFEAFKEEMLTSPFVHEVTAASVIPGYSAGGWRFVPENGSRDNPVMLPLLHTDADFAKTMDMRIVEGRDFDPDSQVDREQGFLINKQAVRELGWEGQALGKKLQHFGPGVNSIAKSGFVIGVVDDFNFESLHHDVRPMVMTYGSNHNFYLLKFTARRYAEVLDYAESKWSAFESDWPMESFLLDSDLQQLYANEEKLSQTIRYFAVIALFITCVGLYAMGAFLILNRAKEISIRKVLGARIDQIFLLVNKDFMKMVLLANLIAWPVAFFFVKDWLLNFAYQTNIHPLFFGIAGLTSVLLVAITTGYHTNRISKANLAQSLRNE